MEPIEKLHRLTASHGALAWPNHYGVVGDYVPNGFFKQLVFPFKLKG